MSLVPSPQSIVTRWGPASPPSMNPPLRVTDSPWTISVGDVPVSSLLGRAFATDWGARNQAVFAAFQDVPSAGRLGRHLWGAGTAADVGGLEMSRQFLQPGDQLLDEHFADERL